MDFPKMTDERRAEFKRRMEENARKGSHGWHVQINRFAQQQREAGEDWPSWMYLAKDLAAEVPRLSRLFALEAQGNLRKVHQQCSHLAPIEIAENELTCCLGQKTATCPYLVALNELEPETQATAKAWTCAMHVATRKGAGKWVDASEGVVLDKSDRMFWDEVYENLAAPSGHPEDQCET